MTISWSLIVPAMLLEAGFFMLLRATGAAEAVSEGFIRSITLLTGTSAVYLISWVGILNGSQSTRRLSTTWIVGAALLFRLTVLPMVPTFTDDLFRYRWEARAQQAGVNPYLVAPDDVPALRDATQPRIPGGAFRSVYGPLTMLVYGQALVPGPVERQVFWMKLPAMVADLGTIGALLLLLRASGRPLAHIGLYAWCPLPVFEFWGNGHNDALMLLPLSLAFWAARVNRWPAAYGLLGLAIGAKIWPAVLIPAFTGLRWTPVRWRWAWVAVAVPILLLVPYDFALLTNAPFLSGFFGGWRNNDFLYGALLELTGDQYRAKYTGFAILGLITVAAARLLPDPPKAALAIIGAMLALAANIHPWYVTWLLPSTVLYPTLTVATVSALIPIAYHNQLHWWLNREWIGISPLRWFIHVPAAVALVYEAAKKYCPAMTGFRGRPAR